MEITLIKMPDDKEIYGETSPYSDEGIALFKSWANQNGVTFYSAPQKEFSMIEAYRMAEKEGNNKLLVDNLS